MIITMNAVKKDQVFIARMSGGVKKALAEIAEEEGTTMSEVILKLLKKELRKRGKRVLIEQEVS